MAFIIRDARDYDNLDWTKTAGQMGDENMAATNFKCAKCSNTEYESSEFRATGGFLSKLFDVQSRKFTTVTCTRCRYTEMYKADSSALGNIFDLFT